MSFQRVGIDQASGPSQGWPGARREFVIFSGSNTRAVVAFCRVLAARGLAIRIIARTANDPILKTRYRRNVAAVRALERLDLDDIDRCIQEVRRTAGDVELVVSPASEFLNLFLLENRDFFASRGCAIPLVDLDLYRCVSDKQSFARICQAEGVATPRGLAIYPLPPFPFVAKPVHNVTAGRRSLYPHLIHGPDDLARFWASENSADFYFEEFVVGPSFYLLYYLSRRGEVTVFSQQNLLQQPGGKSIVLAQAAQAHREPIAGQLAAILQGLGFWGLAMVEVIRRAQGEAGRGAEYVFIELNPRFWGPFQLLLNAGSPIIDRFVEDQLNLRSGLDAPGGTGLLDQRESGLDTPGGTGLLDRRSYLWLGGIVESWAGGGRLAWHVEPPRRRAWFVARHLGSDVYLRADSAGLFAHELIGAARKKKQP
jgi:hypothetical protein